MIVFLSHGTEICSIVSSSLRAHIPLSGWVIPSSLRALPLLSVSHCSINANGYTHPLWASLMMASQSLSRSAQRVWQGARVLGGFPCMPPRSPPESLSACALPPSDASLYIYLGKKTHLCPREKTVGLERVNGYSGQIFPTPPHPPKTKTHHFKEPPRN